MKFHIGVRWELGSGIHALVFGAFPMVRVIQGGLDGALPWRGGVCDGITARWNTQLSLGVSHGYVIQDGLDGARPGEA